MVEFTWSAVPLCVGYLVWWKRHELRESKMFRFQQSFKVTFIPGCRESQQNAHVKAVLDEVRPTLYRLNDPKIVF
jgi:hypothetical protein